MMDGLERGQCSNNALHFSIHVAAWTSVDDDYLFHVLMCFIIANKVIKWNSGLCRFLHCLICKSGLSYIHL